MTLRIAVIGAGVMGADHAGIVAQDLPGATLQVVCDPDLRRATVAAQGAEVADDPLAVIARADVDAVIIASPDATHAPLTLACLSAGKPVLCEKPLSPSLDDCRAVLDAEQAVGRRLVQLGFMRRFDRAYAEMKAALDAGHLGPALMLHNFHRNMVTPLPGFTGAMAITNSAPHEFDIARHLLGVDPASITATQARRSDTLVAPVVMVLETTQGQIVTVEINNNAGYGYDVRAELVGETASISMHPVAYTRSDRALGSRTTYDADWRSRYAEAYRSQARAFLRFAQTGVFPALAASAWDGYAATVTAEAGVRALATGVKTPVTLPARPDFYA